MIDFYYVLNSIHIIQSLSHRHIWKLVFNRLGQRAHDTTTISISCTILV